MIDYILPTRGLMMDKNVSRTCAVDQQTFRSYLDKYNESEKVESIPLGIQKMLLVYFEDLARQQRTSDESMNRSGRGGFIPSYISTGILSHYEMHADIFRKSIQKLEQSRR